MASKSQQAIQPFYWLLGSAALVIVIAGMQLARSLVVPMLIAAFIAVICTPALQWLQRKGAPGWLAIVIVFLCVSIVVLAVASIMTSSITSFIENPEKYTAGLIALMDKVTEWIDKIPWPVDSAVDGPSPDASGVAATAPDVSISDAASPEVLGVAPDASEVEATSPQNEETDFPSPDALEDAVTAPDVSELDIASPEVEETNASMPEVAEADSPFQLTGIFNPKTVVSYTTWAFRSMLSAFSNAFLVLLTVLFILVEAAGFPRKLKAISQGNSKLLDQAEEIRESIAQYVSLKTAVSLLTGVLVGILVWALGIDFPILWAMLAFFFNFIPNIGSIIAAMPAVLLAIGQHDFLTGLLTAIGYAAINIIIGNVVEPRVMGKGLGLSTLVVFISLVFWGWILGPVGMLLSVPLTMIVKIVMEGFDETRWLSVLLGSNPEPEKG